MINFKVAKLTFEMPLHLSKGKGGNESSTDILHSDTIKSALYAVGKQYLQEVFPEDFLDRFFISSAFPYYQQEYFFPKPMIRLPFKKYANLEEDKVAIVAKELKKIQFLGLHHFVAAINQDSTKEIQSKDILDNKGQFISDRFSEKNAGKIIVYKKATQQRVNVPIYGEERDALPFYIEKIYFNEGAGLYILIDPSITTADLELLGKLLTILGEEGVGTNKNLGGGQFTFTGFESVDLAVDVPTSDAIDAWLALSTYCPTNKEEIDKEQILNKSAFSLLKRGGWIASPKAEAHLDQRKRSIYMFQEGSVFAFPEKDQKILIKGKMVDLQPAIWEDEGVGHPIYRDGRGIFIPIKC